MTGNCVIWWTLNFFECWWKLTMYCSWVFRIFHENVFRNYKFFKINWFLFLCYRICSTNDELTDINPTSQNITSTASLAPPASSSSSLSQQSKTILPSPLSLLANHTNSINQSHHQSSPHHLNVISATTTTSSQHLLSNHHHHQHHNSPLSSISGLNLSSGSSNSNGGNGSSSSNISNTLNSSLITSNLNISSITNSTSSNTTTSDGINLSSSSSNCNLNLNISGTTEPLQTSELGMSHWISEGTVKSEIRSPGLDIGGIVGSSSVLQSSVASTSHLDTSSLFGTNPSLTLDTVQGTNAYEHKQDYYNYYNSMQQYTPPFYSTYGTAYSSRATTKLPSPNTYLQSSYATNNNSTQLYPTYGYNNFGQFGTAQQDYSTYYNDQYSSYYNTTGYSPYASSPGSSGSQTFHVASGLPESPSDGHPTTPTLLAHSPNSPLSISPTSSLSTKTTPTSKSGRSRGRRHQQSSPTRSVASDTAITENVKAPDRVFIWDLDETIIIFHSLLTGSYANRYNKVTIFLVQHSTKLENCVIMVGIVWIFSDLSKCQMEYQWVIS